MIYLNYQVVGGNWWLKQQLRLGDEFLEWVINKATGQQYRFATIEALAFLQWLKRFADAALPKVSER